MWSRISRGRRRFLSLPLQQINRREPNPSPLGHRLNRGLWRQCHISHHEDHLHKGLFESQLQGRRNRLEIHDSMGARHELPQHYYERFREAFVTEVQEFVACCLDNKPPLISL